MDVEDAGANGVEGVTPVTSLQERPVFFSAAGETLFGILAAPDRQARDVGVVLLPGSRVLSTGRNRMFVRACRELGGLGYHVLRFDYHGWGESTGQVERFALDEPFTSDLLGAVEHLRKRGLGEFVLVGTCFGARTALSSAPEIDGLKGVVLVSAPVRDFEMGQRSLTRLARDFDSWELLKRGFRSGKARQIFRRKSRRVYANVARFKVKATSDRMFRREAWENTYKLSANFLRPLSSLAGRGVHILLVYGEDEDYYKEFQIAGSGVLGSVLEAHPRIEVATLPGVVRGFSSVAVQDAVIRLICDRLPLWTGPVPTEDVQWTST